MVAASSHQQEQRAPLEIHLLYLVSCFLFAVSAQHLFLILPLVLGCRLGWLFRLQGRALVDPAALHLIRAAEILIAALLYPVFSLLLGHGAPRLACRPGGAGIANGVTWREALRSPGLTGHHGLCLCHLAPRRASDALRGTALPLQTRRSLQPLPVPWSYFLSPPTPTPPLLSRCLGRPRKKASMTAAGRVAPSQAPSRGRCRCLQAHGVPLGLLEPGPLRRGGEPWFGRIGGSAVWRWRVLERAEWLLQPRQSYGLLTKQWTVKAVEGAAG